MLKTYKIQINGNDNNVLIPLTTNYSTKLNDFETNNIDSYINPIISLEKESYSPVSNYKIVLNFLDNSKQPIYNSQWEWAGFDMTIDVNKNVFKKSLLLLEFYDNNNLGGNNMEFATTININPNPITHKGCDTLKIGTATTYYSTFTVNDYRNELYNIFYKRDILNDSNIMYDNTSNLKYVSLYLKTMFLNAKTGKVQYFINLPTNNNISNDMFFSEIRFYENYTYGFFSSGVSQSIVTLNEY